MTRVLVSALFASVVLSIVSCGGEPASPARDGESCLDTPNQYTCSTDLETILKCDDSHIWREHTSCDDNCGYTEADACCTVDGASVCPAQAE